MMGKKKMMSSTTSAPVFPFPAAAEEAAETQHDHFSDYGFDPQLHFFQVMEDAKRPTKRHHHQPPPLDSARFKLQKPISKDKKHRHSKNHYHNHRGHGRRRWWSSAASAALLFFKRPCKPTTTTSSGDYYPSHQSVSGPLYLADVDVGGGDARYSWPVTRTGGAPSGQLAAAELGAASAVVPYVSLRGVNLLSGGGGGGGAPAMPIYLVT